uniref:Uncharacterized protein n=1 Tax=Desertifilum tharense IPPAS B-1220 TaxID=1781255 RepID=A0ACD5GWA7_9CYAN
MDITERKRTEWQLRFISETSRVLASSLDYQTTLDRIVGAIVPELVRLVYALCLGRLQNPQTHGGCRFARD